MIVHTDKVLRGLVFQAENRGFSPGTPPVNQPLSPGNSIALHAFAKQAARRNRDGRLKGPCVRIAVPNIDGADADEKRKEELTKQGTKRKRAPPTKGPCEHGVKQRSKCKVCSACPHGRWRHHCKECGGASFCEHGRERYKCKECGGKGICEHGRHRHWCKECHAAKQ